MSEPRLMTVADVAAYTKLSEQSVQRWVAQGRLPKPLKDTQRWDRRAIDAHLDRLSGIDGDTVEATGYDEIADLIKGRAA
jgi:predicted DNA-binding transcriptional regulator AlpA